MQPTSDTSIVILSAGLGTRMRSRKAKVLHRAGGLALVEHVVRTALELAPPENILVVVGYQAEEVRRTLAGYGVSFAHQPEQKGTGDALAVCRPQLGSKPGKLMVLYGDCPLLSAATLRELSRRHDEAGVPATVLTTTLDDPSGYGRILHDADGHVRAIVEHRAATPEQLAVHEINSGIYCFNSELLWKHIGEIRPDNPAAEYYLTDMIAIFRHAGYPVASLHLADPSEVLGINTRVELAGVDRLFRQRKTTELMLAGVTIEKPETVTIDAGVIIGMDTVVEPFAQILGRTRIGEECRIGASAILRDAVVADGAQVLAFSHVEESELEPGARVGPFSRLRMSSHLEPGAVVGNFVELKKTRLGAGAKAQHLAYLGDSTVGAKVNIGAGTITCNYDGARKHPTTIGAGAFIGSNATLVAPVEVGAGSYVGAGSVVTENVPADALALGRARQTTKDGWAARRRAGATASLKAAKPDGQ
jgi:bifunctional UDP-N-acetylglucosamine pyrophosphorylase/glucosamine-1-phosphate N-acetyltransferase